MLHELQKNSSVFISHLVDTRRHVPGYYQLIALEKTDGAIDYTDFKPEFPLALVLGNEIKGVSKNILKKSDKIIYLPMQGSKESLNVSVAFGVAGYYIRN